MDGCLSCIELGSGYHRHIHMQRSGVRLVDAASSYILKATLTIGRRRHSLTLCTWAPLVVGASQELGRFTRRIREICFIWSTKILSLPSHGPPTRGVEYFCRRSPLLEFITGIHYSSLISSWLHDDQAHFSWPDTVEFNAHFLMQNNNAITPWAGATEPSPTSHLLLTIARRVALGQRSAINNQTP